MSKPRGRPVSADDLIACAKLARQAGLVDDTANTPISVDAHLEIKKLKARVAELESALKDIRYACSFAESIEDICYDVLVKANKG